MINQPPGQLVSRTDEEVVLQQVVQGHGSLSAYGHGTVSFEAQMRVGTLLLAPPLSEVVQRTSDPISLLALGVPVKALDVVLGGDGLVRIAPLFATSFRDPFIALSLERLWCDSAAEGETGELFADTLIDAIIARLGMLALDMPKTERAVRALSEPALAQVLTAIDAGLEGPLEVGTLAELVGLSRFHFCRAFRQSVGIPPHQFVLARRIERARFLVTETSLSLADIAYACGFASQAHMTTTFTRVTGVSPGKLRQLRNPLERTRR